MSGPPAAGPVTAMAGPGGGHGRRRHGRLRDRLNALIARSDFQGWAARFPLTRGLVRREGAALFDLVAGFAHAQTLAALIEMGTLDMLRDGPRQAEDLCAAGVPPERMRLLLRAGAALGLLVPRRDGAFALAPRGAALLGVPGLADIVRHHRAFYADMADPVSLLRGKADTRLAAFWPYVRGATGEVAAAEARRYSDLMARTQDLVAEDVLRMVDLGGVRRLLDLGGGSGAFLAAVARAHPAIALDLLDLPAVIPEARARLAQAGLAERVVLHAGSFREVPIPVGVDAITLIRVLYDHDDATAAALLSKAHDALPAGGRLIIAEPMSGGARPDRAGDVYFAFYCLAMGTGRVRTAGRIAELCRAAGFTGIRVPRPPRPYIASALTCVKAD